MKRKLLTDLNLRTWWSRNQGDTYTIESGTILTPAAKDFVKEHRIKICVSGDAGGTESMTMTRIPMQDGRPVYIDAATGKELREKPEEMTHLHGNVLVPKTHPRIEFRGRLDSLMADIINVQWIAEQEGEAHVVSDLEELLQYARNMMAAEVKDEAMQELCLLGLDEAEIRRSSHLVKKTFGIDHPVPNYRMGRLCVGLNYLRTRIRETELSAARAFYHDGCFEKLDIIEGLNRMSSCTYIILCRKLSGWYNGGKRP